jgi:hypothetical protein
MVVDTHGKRLAHEATSYMGFGQRMYEANAVPAWAIFDSRIAATTLGRDAPRCVAEVAHRKWVYEEGRDFGRDCSP